MDLGNATTTPIYVLGDVYFLKPMASTSTPIATTDTLLPLKRTLLLSLATRLWSWLLSLPLRH